MKSQAKRCDKLFADKIKSRGRCERCGKRDYLQTAHIISRRYRQVRWDLNNALCLDRNCHVYFTSHPIEFENYIISKIGQEAYNILRKKALEYKKLDYIKILERLKG